MNEVAEKNGMQEDQVKRERELVAEQHKNVAQQIKEAQSKLEEISAQVSEHEDDVLKKLLEDSARLQKEQVETLRQQERELREKHERLTESLKRMQQLQQQQQQQQQQAAAQQAELDNRRDLLEQTAKLGQSISSQQKIQGARGAREMIIAFEEKKAIIKQLIDVDEIARRIPAIKAGDTDGRSVARTQSDDGVGKIQDNWSSHEHEQSDRIAKLEKMESDYAKSLKAFREHVEKHGLMQEKVPAAGITPDGLKEYQLLQEQQRQMVKDIEKARSDIQNKACEIKMHDMQFNVEAWARVGSYAKFSGDDGLRQKAEIEQQKLKESIKDMSMKSGISIDRADEQKREVKAHSVSEAYLKNKIDPLSKNGLTEQQKEELARLEEKLARRLESRREEELKHKIKQSR